MSEEKQNVALIDLPAEDDWLGSGKYVEGLTEYVCNCPTPMTVSVQAEWGAGKSTFLKMMKNKINAIDDICFLEFNAWLFSQFTDGNNLPILMLDYFIDELNTEGANKRNSVFRNKVFNVIKFGTKLFTGGATNGEELFESFQKSPLSEYIELRNEIQNTLADRKENKIVFAIDDLDRIEPDKAVELLEVLKNFFDFEKCVLLLAIDYDVIARGLRIKYGSDFDENKSKSFFDKIIQVPFKIPVSNLEHSNYVKICLEQVGLTIDEKEVSAYCDLVKYSIGDNPRAIKRLINLYSLQRTINSKVNEKDSVNSKLLFGMMCLQNSYEEIYNNLLLEKDKINLEYLQDFFNGEDWHMLIQNAEKSEKYKKFLGCFSSCVKIKGNNEETYDLESFIAILTVNSVTMLLESKLEKTTAEKLKNYGVGKRIGTKINEKYPSVKFKPVNFSETVGDEVKFYIERKIANQIYGLLYKIYTYNNEKLLSIEFYLNTNGVEGDKKISDMFEDTYLNEQSNEVVYSDKGIKYIFCLTEEASVDIIEKCVELYMQKSRIK